MELRLRISNQFPGDAEAAGPGTTLGVARPLHERAHDQQIVVLGSRSVPKSLH